MDILENPGRYSKFIIAALTVVAFFGNQFGLDLPEGWVNTTTDTVTGLLLAVSPILIYLWPNKG